MRLTLEAAIINGDKVMQIANDYEKEVFNGDVGTIDGIDADNSELSVLFPSSEAGAAGSRAVIYGWGELDTLVPAYACTIHKSQGSEYPAVVIPLLTRGKQQVVLVGQKKALAMAVKNHLGRRRYTKLVEWLSSPSRLQSSSPPAAGRAAIDGRWPPETPPGS